MLTIIYVIGATAAALVSVLFAAFAREQGMNAPGQRTGVAVAAGLLWPVLIIGLVQWLLIAAVQRQVSNSSSVTAEPEVWRQPRIAA